MAILRPRILRAMPYRLDLAALAPHELVRALGEEAALALAPSLAAARAAGTPLLAPDLYPDDLRLRVAFEADWDALGASVEHALITRSLRQSLVEMDFVQVGAFRLEFMPYPRLFFAYTKTIDTIAALSVSDAEGPAPYLELITSFASPKDGIQAVVTTNHPGGDPLDVAPSLLWLAAPGATPEQSFQLHRSKLLELGSGRVMRTTNDFSTAYLAIWQANFAYWRERGVFKPV
jgi:hypothetical protein